MGNVAEAGERAFDPADPMRPRLDYIGRRVAEELDGVSWDTLNEDGRNDYRETAMAVIEAACDWSDLP